MWQLHEQRCLLMGTDPRFTAPIDPNRGYHLIWNPQTGQWQTIPMPHNVPSIRTSTFQQVPSPKNYLIPNSQNTVQHLPMIMNQNIPLSGIQQPLPPSSVLPYMNRHVPPPSQGINLPRTDVPPPNFNQNSVYSNQNMHLLQNNQSPYNIQQNSHNLQQNPHNLQQNPHILQQNPQNPHILQQNSNQQQNIYSQNAQHLINNNSNHVSHNLMSQQKIIPQHIPLPPHQNPSLSGQITNLNTMIPPPNANSPHQKYPSQNASRAILSTLPPLLPANNPLGTKCEKTEEDYIQVYYFSF